MVVAHAFVTRGNGDVVVVAIVVAVGSRSQGNCKRDMIVPEDVGDIVLTVVDDNDDQEQQQQ